MESMEELEGAEVIFGSRFPQDLEYTQICININRIRLAMDKGRRVILLNLETLYESLYELLNQSYTEMKGDRFVEIGLGTHRHRTRVHPDFRLIVVAEHDEVRRTFPAALVNRLEKHAYFLKTDLALPQRRLADTLARWAAAMTKSSPLLPFPPLPSFTSSSCSPPEMGARGQGRLGEEHRFEEEDVFVGFTADAVFSLVTDRHDSVQRDLTEVVGFCSPSEKTRKPLVSRRTCPG